MKYDIKHLETEEKVGTFEFKNGAITITIDGNKDAEKEMSNMAKRVFRLSLVEHGNKTAIVSEKISVSKENIPAITQFISMRNTHNYYVDDL